MKNRLTIAIQKKGRLFDQSADLIRKSGINFSTKGDNLLAKRLSPLVEKLMPDFLIKSAL